ncbi:Membrane associated serine protease, rhomboid family [Loktanella fryxellensis]|uniref:Membrane associated serine protease, rhomboid family n=1 Tax=Loktanella fryxellensis TaxID=245187 RepID=A0A1H8GMY1_9RHOB|nr:rhomboid family intramembrane serine protease [Loktanella fryxellensis]SEN45372.1 Membrane associated serine protease, rhomboid family [Loktanella fryxellensis]
MFPIRDHNPSSRTPWVSHALIVANVAIWLWTAVAITDETALWSLYYDYALIPALLTGGEGLTGLLTAMFLHAGPLHLAGNMLFLFIFGDNLEDRMGHVPFALFYAACGVAAGLAQIAVDPWSAVPTVGASGAIAGVMGGYLLLFPRARVDMLLVLIVIFKVIPIPAWLLLGLWFALQVWGGLGPQADAGVAYAAHVGGFVAGIALTLPLWLRLGGPRFWQATDGHPPHPAAAPIGPGRVPLVRRR